MRGTLRRALQMSACSCGGVLDPICDVHGDPVTVSRSWLDDLEADLKRVTAERDAMQRAIRRHDQAVVTQHLRPCYLVEGDLQDIRTGAALDATRKATGEQGEAK